jgi:3-hydroxymyristoyl/3-hydroxydecanoyl-(acyl carrier protein) dehydratase
VSSDTQHSALSTRNWLLRLPHQIPFRAASKFVRRDEKTIEGSFLCTANDTATPEIMLVEAMAQFAGGMVFARQGFVSGIDGCEVSRAIEAGDVVDIVVALEVSFGGTHRFSARGSIGGVEVVHARFYLADSHAQT